MLGMTMRNGLGLWMLAYTASVAFISFLSEMWLGCALYFAAMGMLGGNLIFDLAPWQWIVVGCLGYVLLAVVKRLVARGARHQAEVAK